MCIYAGVSVLQDNLLETEDHVQAKEDVPDCERFYFTMFGAKAEWCENGARIAGFLRSSLDIVNWDHYLTAQCAH